MEMVLFFFGMFFFGSIIYTNDLCRQAEHEERARDKPIAKRETSDHVPSPKAKPIPCDTRNIPAWPIR